MISIKNLVKRYGNNVALDQLSVEIASGTIFGLLGPNGAGKTTLISILNGLTTYESGEVSLFNQPLKNHLQQIRQRCSLVPQTLAFYDNLTVKENLHFFAGIQNLKGDERQKNIDYAIETNRLRSMLSQKAVTLSGGQKRRLNIAIGLLNNPDILFFDEPTVGIDPESRNEILETIRSFKADNKTVVYTSHYMPEIETLCDDVAIINAGKIIKQGSITSMLTNESAEQVVIELYDTRPEQLQACCVQCDPLSIIDNTTLLLNSKSSEVVSQALSVLETHRVAVKHVRYGSTTLESLFINLTSKGRVDV
jgi:ABC-2 type transport system ATP-binding protein